MSQLGAQDFSSYPTAIDTRMIAENAPNAAPKSATRVDAQWLNSLAHAIVNVERTLGANPQGVFGSVAARLQQGMPGGAASPLTYAFAAQEVWTIPGTTHRLATAALHVRAYDTGSPAQAIVPQSVTIDQTTYDVVLTFATAQSGFVLLHGGPPQYTGTFTDDLSVTILGTTHGLETGALLVTVFTDEAPKNVLTPGTVTIDQTTFDVSFSFVTAQSGSYILSAAGPRYHTTFLNESTLTVSGATHQLNSHALLCQVLDGNDPPAIIYPPLTVDAGTYDVTLTFAAPQSGSVLLVKASAITGSDFVLRDAGIDDSTATRVYSEAGSLHLQYGSGDTLQIENKDGLVRALMDAAGNFGLGTTPAFQLHLTGNAAKPGGGTWETTSDERLKKVLRPFTDGLAIALQIDPVWYTYNGLGGIPQTGHEHVGVLAQAVQAVAHYMVGQYRGVLTPGSEETDILTYDGHAMTFVLLNAIKELANLVEGLTSRLTQVETTLALLQEPPA